MTQTNSEPDWKAIAEDRAQTIDDLCNRAWGAVYGKEHETEWEYPAQAIRHLIQAYREVKATLAYMGIKVSRDPRYSSE